MVTEMGYRQLVAKSEVHVHKFVVSLESDLPILAGTWTPVELTSDTIGTPKPTCQSLPSNEEEEGTVWVILYPYPLPSTIFYPTLFIRLPLPTLQTC